MNQRPASLRVISSEADDGVADSAAVLHLVFGHGRKCPKRLYLGQVADAKQQREQVEFLSIAQHDDVGKSGRPAVRRVAIEGDLPGAEVVAPVIDRKEIGHVSHLALELAGLGPAAPFRIHCVREFIPEVTQGRAGL